MEHSSKPYNVRAANRFFFARFSEILNEAHAPFDQADVERIARECSLSETESLRVLYEALLFPEEESAACRALCRDYFPHMLHVLSAEPYLADAYLNTVRLPARECSAWQLCEKTLVPYSLFVFDDPLTLSDGRVIPQIGAFDTDFSYPAVLEGGREWMTVTPNEQNTMRAPIARAHGRVLTFGLGLGYFAFHASEKKEVGSVTVVERDETVIRLFSEEILGQFPAREKIRIVHADAFDFAEEHLVPNAFDYVFTDLWHDAADGVPLYLKMKEYESRVPGAHFDYWIEKTLKLYL